MQIEATAMKFNRILSGIFLLSLVNINACANQPPKNNNKSKYSETEVEISHHHPVASGGFKYNPKTDSFIPLSSNGKPYESCGTLDKNDCTLMKEKIQIKKLKPIQVILIEFEVNPHCKGAIVGKRIYIDMNNPHCLKH